MRSPRKTHRIGRARGFTLLEVMIAMAILSGALTWLIVGVSRNIKAENHAKLITTATLLARQRMIDLEDELREKGFGEFEKELNGTFEDKGFARFTWKAIVDKVELPSQEQLQTVLSNAQQAQQTLQGSQTGTPTGPLGGMFGGGGGNGGSSGNPLSASAGALGSEFGIIKDVLEQAIRRVTIKVGWLEGRTPQEVEVIAYYTDVRRVDQAIQLAQPPAQGPAGGGGGGGGGGAGGGSAGGGGGSIAPGPH